MERLKILLVVCMQFILAFYETFFEAFSVYTFLLCIFVLLIQALLL